MKSIPLVLFSSVCLALADGPIGPPVDDRLLREVRERDAARRALVIERDPRIPVSKVPLDYRMVGYDIVNIGEIQQWEQLSKNHGTAAGARPMREWIHVNATVYDNKDGAVRLGVSYLMGSSGSSYQIWLVDPPQYPMLTQSRLNLFLKANGRVRGDGSPEYVHGKSLTAEQARAALAPPPVRLQSIEEIATTQNKVVTYQLNQASNGYPSFQIEVAKRYLDGNGVEANRDLAIHWLRAACTNGEAQASNLLAKAQAPLADK